MKLDFNNSKILKCLYLHILNTYEITQQKKKKHHLQTSKLSGI